MGSELSQAKDSRVVDLMARIAVVAKFERERADDVTEFGPCPRTTESEQCLIGELRDLAASAMAWADEVWETRTTRTPEGVR